MVGQMVFFAALLGVTALLIRFARTKVLTSERLEVLGWATATAAVAIVFVPHGSGPIPDWAPYAALVFMGVTALATIGHLWAQRAEHETLQRVRLDQGAPVQLWHWSPWLVAAAWFTAGIGVLLGAVQLLARIDQTARVSGSTAATPDTGMLAAWQTAVTLLTVVYLVLAFLPFGAAITAGLVQAWRVKRDRRRYAEQLAAFERRIAREQARAGVEFASVETHTTK